MRLEGKRAIVTGGSRGIGRGIALAMAREGAKIAVNYASNATAADEVVKMIKSEGGEAISVRANVTKKIDVEGMIRKTVDAFGGIDILVNNAGVCHFIDFFDV